MSEDAGSAGRYYRLDRFVVPNGVRAEFLEIVRATHAALKQQPGYLQDFIIEQPLSDQRCYIATLVEWQDERYTVNARVVVAGLHQRIGFDRQEFIARTGIEAEFGSYRAVGS